MKKQQLLRRFRLFCSKLEKSDRVGIIHHSDADGICSALIAGKAIERLTGNKPVVVSHYEYGNRELGRIAVERIKRAKANTLVVVDIGIDSIEQSVGEAYPFEKCLVIDHHKMRQDLNAENIVFLKAEFFTKKDPSAYVASKFAFDLFNKVIKVGDLDWLVCIGIIGDMGLEHWQGFVKKTLRKRGLSLTQLYSVLDLIASVEVFAGGKINELFWRMYDASSLEEILNSKFRVYLLRFKREKDKLISGFEENAERLPELELLFYSIRARHENIKSYVINELSQLYPNKTLILLQSLERGRLRFSARRQDFKVKVNDLLVQAVKGIPNATAGGHAPAAAGSIPAKHLDRFKKNIVEILKKKYRK